MAVPRFWKLSTWQAYRAASGVLQFTNNARKGGLGTSALRVKLSISKGE